MIDRIEFKNFKALRDTSLSLGRLTLIVGPNGSGKSTALQAIPLAVNPGKSAFADLVTHGFDADVQITIHWGKCAGDARTTVRWHREPGMGVSTLHMSTGNERLSNAAGKTLSEKLQSTRIFTLDAYRILQPVTLVPQLQLAPTGAGLAGVLDRLRDNDPERFDALNYELQRWLPEFNRVLFDVPQEGRRSLKLRTISGFQVPASELSHGTLLALAILTLAYLPDPPPLVAFEDPDRGLHPRLLREVRDALYRLAYPENYGEAREPVQVIATTHSPYLLDLFRDHPQEIVIAEKCNGEADFESLSERPDIEEILADASLGEVWFSGVLGGVPVGT